MDAWSRKSLILTALFGLSACGNPDRAETVLPNIAETCGGTAISKKYIVHFHDGSWDYVENSDRQEFKEKYVRPKIDAIDFIEYDQKISLEADSPTEIRTAGLGIDNWGQAAIHADLVWSKNYRGQNTVVAVVDTGVDVSHQQLESQIFLNAGEAGSKQNNGLDDDGNGFVDDYYGFNFSEDDNDVSDTQGHGTHVAGIIAAAHEDVTIKSGYVQGIAPQAQILPVKFLGPNGGTLSSALKGIDYAIKRGANIINASWGGTGCSQSLRQKMVEVSKLNIIMVVAAGNEGNNLEFAPEYPAAFNLPLQITVGAISTLLNLADYSNYSKNLVHLFAPGSQVVSTIPGNTYASFSGTSMAAPFVSGAAAVYLSAHPEWSPTQVRNQLLSDVTTDLKYVNTSRGRLDLSKLANAMGL